MIRNVKLPVHRQGLPGRVVSFHIVPPPACRQAGTGLSRRVRDGARDGQVFGGETTSIQLRSSLRDDHESEDLIHASVEHWR